KKLDYYAGDPLVVLELRDLKPTHMVRLDGHADRYNLLQSKLREIDTAASSIDGPSPTDISAAVHPLPVPWRDTIVERPAVNQRANFLRRHDLNHSLSFAELVGRFSSRDGVEVPHLVHTIVSRTRVTPTLPSRDDLRPLTALYLAALAAGLKLVV